MTIKFSTGEEPPDAVLAETEGWLDEAAHSIALTLRAIRMGAVSYTHLNPEITDFLYFVADGTGGHAFATTLEAHNENVAKWRAIEKARGEAETGVQGN